MSRNKLKMICNPLSNHISYFFMNEQGNWVVLSENSPLSRQSYTNVQLDGNAETVIAKADEVYNRRNKGLDIVFEGSIAIFKHFKEELIKYSEQKKRDLTCKLGYTKIAVIGKAGSGKTSLIKGMQQQQKTTYNVKPCEGYTKYCDDDHQIEWLEIRGIEIGRGKVEEAERTISSVSDGLSCVVYCILGNTGRIEETELALINRLARYFARATVMIALTKCYQDDEDIQETCDAVRKATNQLKVIPTLALPYPTSRKDKNGNSIVVSPYGLDGFSKYVFEGL